MLNTFCQLFLGYLSIFRPNRFEDEWRNFHVVPGTPHPRTLGRGLTVNAFSGTSKPTQTIHGNLEPGRRADASFVILARNSDLAGTAKSIREIEDRFNSRYRYPYVLLNDEPFDDKFRECVAPSAYLVRRSMCSIETDISPC